MIYSTIDRQHLWQRLDEGIQRTLTLVCAPAGYGKSTLLEQWRSRSPWPVGLLKLSEHDGNPLRIAAGLAMALQQMEMIVPDVEPSSAQDWVIDLLNAAALLPQDAALIIDSHLASQQPLADLLAPCLDYLPPQLHLFIASRAVPGLRLGRLRMRGQVGELSAADLAFTAGETRRLAETNGVRAASGRIEALHGRSEGWVTALHLILAGEDEEIAAYLEQEALAPQPAPVRRFLCDTCRLERLSAAACNAATGRNDSQQMLEWLEPENLFVFPLDKERREYRYHGMWKEFLASQ